MESDALSLVSFAPAGGGSLPPGVGAALAGGDSVLASRCAPYHFLQTDFWASFKAAHGWTRHRFEGAFTLGSGTTVAAGTAFSAGTPVVGAAATAGTASGGEPCATSSTYKFTVSVLVRQFARFFSIAYIPLGVELPQNAPFDVFSEQYLCLLGLVADSLKKQLSTNLFCVRFDPPVEFIDLDARDEWIKRIEERNKLSQSVHKKIHAKKSPVDIQPPDTVLLSLAPDTDALLAAMKPKWRYNVRLAEKKGVVVKRCGAESVDDFYRLFEETAKRDGIAVHGKSYYRDILERGAGFVEPVETTPLADTALAGARCAGTSGSALRTGSVPASVSAAATGNDTPKVTLYLALYENEPIAGIITLFTKTEAVYLYGASSNSHRNVMPAYLLQWTAIQDAKAFGAQVYDFYGCPPTDDERHPMHGLYRFKTGFGGTLVHRAGSLDVPVKKTAYALYRLAEKARAFYFKKVRKVFR